MITVMTIFGTRPEAIKMAPVIRALEARPDEFRSVIAVTGQHRGMLDQVLHLFEIVPDYDLDVMSHNQSLARVTTRVLDGLDALMESERPNWVLVQGDTTTAMAGSVAAFYHDVQIGHIEAGLRTHDKHHPFPEEINRRIISVVADRHFAPTQWAAGNLRAEGVPSAAILVTGNTVIDAIRLVAAMPFDPHGRLPDDVIRTRKRIVLVTAHRRESFGEGICQICEALGTLASLRDDVQIVYPVHPNPHIQEPVYRRLFGVRNVTLLDPLDYQPLVWLMKHSYLVITDSGGIQEEAPGLGKPVLLLRDTTERPEGVLAGTVKMVGTDADRIVRAAGTLLDSQSAYLAMARATNPYGDGFAAERVIDSLSRVRSPVPV